MSNNKDFLHLLNLATLNDLQVFAADYAKENEHFKTSLSDFLTRKYNHNEKTSQEYVRKMRNAFAEYTDIGDRWHRFEITNWSAIMDNVDRLVKEGWKLLKVGNADTAALMAAAFFTAFADEFDENEILNATEYDNVDVGTTAESVGELLSKALTHPSISKEAKQKVMNELNAFSSTDVPYCLNNYGFYDFDGLLNELSQRVLTDDDVLAMLDKQIAQHAGLYDQHTYVERKLDLLRKLHRDKEADKVEQKYIHLEEIRKIVANRMLDAKDYDGAIKQVREGIRDADNAKEPGITAEWDKYLLHIYQTMGDKEKIISQLRHLFIDNWNSRKEYYHALKKLIPATEWKEYFHRLIADAHLTFSPTFTHDLLADLYVEEGETEPVFNFLVSPRHKSLDLMNTYSKYAGEEHAAELLAKYAEMLRDQAKRHATAKSYSTIAESMRAMDELKGGKAAAHKLALEFRELYHRRPLMMKEIRNF